MATGETVPRGRQVRLPDGRVVSFTCYGAPSGPVVVVLDGAGSRAQADLLGPVAARLGIVLLAPDRPGFRGSSPAPVPGLLGCADTLVDVLDVLALGRVGVLAQSLGAPFALALARAAPDRVRHLGLIGPIGPLDTPGACDGMDRTTRTVFALARRAPLLLEGPFRLMRRSVERDPERAADRFARLRPIEDQEIMRRPTVWPTLVEHFPELWASPAAVRREFAAVARPWGFEVGSITVPTTIWAAVTDTVHPPAMARDLARRLPQGRLVLAHRGGVFGFLDRGEELLRTVVPAKPTPPT
jgi:pimeloyl-ACP methyl ester carboxylesterase